jgi:hypothetical protein
MSNVRPQMPSTSLCIWCLNHAVDGHEEHIVPKPLGCPEGFVLPGSVVCRACNNGMADLDQAVIDDFDFLAFNAGIRRKRGRPPGIHSRGNVVGTSGRGGKELSFNMNRYPVRGHDGSPVGPYRGSERNVKATYRSDGDAAVVRFTVNFASTPKFVRGVTKIALSTLAFYMGAGRALEPQLNAARSFVRHGIGVRHLLIREPATPGYAHSFCPPYSNAGGHFAL